MLTWNGWACNPLVSPDRLRAVLDKDIDLTVFERFGAGWAGSVTIVVLSGLTPCAARIGSITRRVAAGTAMRLPLSCVRRSNVSVPR